MLSSFLKARSGPYAPKTVSMGEIPSVIPDIPICAVLIAFYIGFATTNMTIFQINRRRGHKFIPSAMLFGFCMARIVTLVLRIAWANRQHNARLAITANILVNVGILLVYIINMILAQRIFRAKQPRLGWHSIWRIGTKILYTLVAGALIVVITAMVVSAYSLDPHTHNQCRDAELASITYFLVFACLPVLQVLLAVLLPRSPHQESFGQGRMITKVAILVISSCLCIIIAGFKAGVFWSPPRSRTNPAWYDSKAAFYVFVFALEIVILFTLTLSRIDQRFHIPDGSTKLGGYSGWAQSSSRECEKATDARMKTRQ